MALLERTSPAEVLERIKDVLSVLPGIIQEFDRNVFNAHDEVILQCMVIRATELCSILSGLCTDLEGLSIPTNQVQIFQELINTLYEAIRHVQHYRSRFQEALEWSHSGQNVIDSSQFHLSSDSGTADTAGRPNIMLSREQVSGLISLGFKFKEVSKMVGVHPETLRKLRREWNLPVGRNVFTDMTEEQLDEMIQALLKELPNTGERLIMGALRARGIHVQRDRMRGSLRRLDPVGRALRRRLKIRRRVYSVPCANFLWHADGYHKHIRWRMVIHGCIDGYSRLITFLRCSNDNTAETVLKNFLDALQKFRCPLRIRTDHGTENVRIAEWMLNYHGAHKSPVITGSSVHNQRIERLWVDLSGVVTSHFIELFSYMERQSLLDPENEVHLFALHYVFIPRINNALTFFTDQWNNHPIRTATNYSPLQLWARSFYEMASCGGSRTDLLLKEPCNVGIDDEGPVPDIQTSNNVVVPRSEIHLNEEELTRLCIQYDWTADDGEFGLQLYSRVLDYIKSIV